LVIVSGREQLFALIGEFLQNNAGALKIPRFECQDFTFIINAPPSN